MALCLARRGHAPGHPWRLAGPWGKASVPVGRARPLAGESWGYWGRSSSQWQLQCGGAPGHGHSRVPSLTAPPAGSRALKTRGNTPKYGLIFHSTFIGRAAAKNKGRISRYLANKCTIASRIDCFSGARGGGDGVPGCLCNDGNIFRQQHFTV